MASKYMDEGLTWLFQELNADASGKPLQSLRLFINNFTPDENSVKANFTEMSTLTYIAKTMTSASWGYNLDTVAHKITATTTQNWTFAAGTVVTIYGYYFTDTGNTKVMMAEKFATPFVTLAGGTTLALTINNEFHTCP